MIDILAYSKLNTTHKYQLKYIYILFLMQIHVCRQINTLV